MPVEDVDFLIKNSVQDTYLLFVDSSSRDKAAYSTVSEYEVRFTEPFYNVYGLEVLDAMIPSTRYTIDIGRDEFVFHHVLFNYLKYPLKEKDPAFWSLFNTLHAIPSVKHVIESSYNETNLMTVMPKGLIPTITYSATPTRFRVVEIVEIDNVSGIFADNLPASMSPSDYHLFASASGRVFYIPISAPYFSMIQPYFALQDVIIDLDNSRIVCAEVHSVSTSTHHEICQANIQPGEFTSNGMGFNNAGIYFSMLNFHTALEHGNYDIFSFQTYLNIVIGQSFQYVDGTVPYFHPFNSNSSRPGVAQVTTYGTLEKASKYMINVSEQNVCMFINLTRTTIANAIGFSSMNPTPGLKMEYHVETNWPNKSHLVISMITSNSSNRDKWIKSPGIINLNGLSYVILRCPEIESHMYNSFSYSQNCPGIGMFKLGALNQIFNVRFDFVNFVKKPFHPIGKLSKVTLRFENPDGSLYDFKGVDHHMLLSVKFYVPRLKEPQHKFHLNPNYNPNFLEYMVNEMRIDDEQDNEANEWDERQEDKATVLREKYERLIQEQNEYDYSSEEDQDEIDIVGRYNNHQINA